MATVRAYSVCQSEGGTTQRSRSVYSYSPSVTLQNGDTLDFGGDANSDPENSMRTGLSQAYCHGGVATSGEDSTGAFLAAAARNAAVLREIRGAHVLVSVSVRRRDASLLDLLSPLPREPQVRSVSHVGAAARDLDARLLHETNHQNDHRDSGGGELVDDRPEVQAVAPRIR